MHAASGRIDLELSSRKMCAGGGSDVGGGLDLAPVSMGAGVAGLSTTSPRAARGCAEGGGGGGPSGEPGMSAATRSRSWGGMRRLECVSGEGGRGTMGSGGLRGAEARGMPPGGARIQGGWVAGGARSGDEACGHAGGGSASRGRWGSRWWCGVGAAEGGGTRLPSEVAARG